MSKRAAILPLLAILAIAAAAAWWRFGNSAAEPGPLTLYGNVDIRTAQLAFDGEAIVTAMRVEEGARVRPGDVLATLDDSRIRAELQEARAQAAAQEAAVRRLETGTRKQEIEQARARVASVEARLANADQNLRRITAAAATGASSQQDLDAAHAQVRVEDAALNEARQALALALEGFREEDIQEGRARLEASRARVRVLQDRIAHTELLAPSAGTIRSRLMEPGDYATRGRVAYSLAITDPKWIRAYVPEPSLGRVRHGARAWVTSDSFPSRTFQGWVGFISPVAEFTPKPVETTELRTQLVYEVRVYVKDPGDELRLGMPTTVIVDEASPPAASPAWSTQPASAPTLYEFKELP